MIYCYRCCSNPPEGKTFIHYGKMRPQAQKDNRIRYYRCRAHDLGYSCEQSGINVEIIDDQVIGISEAIEAARGLAHWA